MTHDTWICIMSDTETTTNQFVSQLKADAEKYTTDETVGEYLAAVREEAAEHFLETLLTSEKAVASFLELTAHRNKIRQKTSCVARWQGRGDTYKEQSVSDLLDLGDLLQRMQDYLDATYGPYFRIFNHQVQRTRDTSLTVSWNPDGFAKLDDIIKRNRERATERSARQKSARDASKNGEGDGDERDDSQSYRRDDRSTGRYERGNRQYDDRQGGGGGGGYRGGGGGGHRQGGGGDRSRNDDRQGGGGHRYDDRQGGNRRQPSRDNYNRGGTPQEGSRSGDRPPRRDLSDGGGGGAPPPPSRRRQAVENYDRSSAGGDTAEY
jgi:hypothetical protein